MRNSVHGFLLGVLMGVPMMSLALGPATLTWSADSCPVGVATVDFRAYNSVTRETKILTQVGVTLPKAEVVAQFAELDEKVQWAIVPEVRYQSGEVVYGSFQSFGVTTVPEPTPTPSPTPTPTPDPNQSQNCTRGGTVTDPTAGQWTFGPGKETLRNGVHAGGGLGSVYKLVDGVVWVLGEPAASNAWFKFVGDAWVFVSEVEPTCGVVPQPTPTPQPTVDLAPVVQAVTDLGAKIDAQSAITQGMNLQILAALAKLVPPAPSTCSATVASVSSNYSNGDYRFTVRMPQGQGCTAPVSGLTFKILNPWK
jgi:hypothetical protein